MKITKFLLIILFFTLPLIHGRILPTLGLDLFFSVSGNFEFIKALFFNIFSSLIFFSFFIESFLYRTKNVVSSLLSGENGERCLVKGVIVGAILLLLILSTILSTSPFMSLIGDTEKGHTALMFFNLLGLFVVLRSLDKTFFKTLIYTSLLAGFFVSLLSTKELFFPSFNYRQLAGRALGSFGHPNYLAGYLLLLLPFCSPFPFAKERIQVWIRIIVTLVLLAGIIFSKSIVAIVLALGYIIYSQLQTHLGISSLFKRRGLQFLCLFLIALCFIILIKYYPAKLHSFLSRFYIWETTLRIIASDPKIFLLGAGAETLPYYFDSFKVPQVYIFENYGFTADRPHNFILNIFYHFGVFALGIFCYLVYTFFLSLSKSGCPKGQGLSAEKIAIILFLGFGIIHFFSIASYALIVLIIVASSPCKGRDFRENGDYGQKAACFLLTLISLTGAYYSAKFFQSEVFYYGKQGTQAALENFQHPKYLIATKQHLPAIQLEGISSQKNIKSQITVSSDKQTLCQELTDTYPSAENYMYCGNLFWKLEKQTLAQQYYQQGLSKIPDLWNRDSPYWNNYFIKSSITGNRFFAPKFGNINSILDRVGK